MSKNKIKTDPLLLLNHRKASAEYESLTKVDGLVSENNQLLLMMNSNLFLSWSYPFNHMAGSTAAIEYFALWVGVRGRKTMYQLYFGTLEQIKTYLDETDDHDWVLPTITFKDKFKRFFKKPKPQYDEAN